MDAVGRFIRKVWLPSTLSVVVTAAVYWTTLTWEPMRVQLLSTALITPVIWGALIGKRQPPHPVRALAVGALAGPVTQLAPHIQEIWRLVSHAGSGQGDDQPAAAAEFGLFLMVGFGVLIAGASVGLVVTGIERMARRWDRSSQESSKFGGS